MQITRFQGSPLSVQQAHLWSSQKSSQIYRTLCAIQIQGMLDRDRLKKALEEVIERHEILRTAFDFLPGMDIPMQVISEQALWSYTETSLEELTAPEQRIKIDELFAALKDEAYDLQHGPLLLAQLLSLHANQHILLVSLPALCVDTYSLKLFIEELRNAYMAHISVEEPLQYADVSAWQEEQLLEEEATSQQDYWRKTKLSQITDMKLPFQYEPPTAGLQANEDFAPQEVEITIPARLAQKIEVLAQQYDASVSAWLLACWKILLWRLSDETTFPVGVACDGRNYEDLINALGPYTRFVPVEARFEKDRSFALVLASVNTALQEALKRQLYFTWDAVYGQTKDNTTKHFFPVIFECDTCPVAFEAGSLTFSLLKRWSCTEPFILKLSALQVGKSMQLGLHYNPQRITMVQAHALANLFRTLLEQVTEQPQEHIGMISLFTSSERAHLLATFSGPKRTWPEQTLCQLFEAQVRQRPNELAVISSQEQLTYRQLNERANQLAHVLRKRGVKPNTVVGLSLTRQASMLVGLLGILKTGGAYLPLDVSHPQARLLYQLQESGALLLLTQKEVREHLPTWAGSIVTMEELAEELSRELGRGVTSRAPSSQAESHGGTQGAREVTPLPSSPTKDGGPKGDDLAYVIYTSGSTGAPKGVMISQRNVANYTRALCEQLEAEPGWQYATVSTLAADLGNTAIFCSLASGGCVHVLEYEQVTSAEAMATWAEQHPIDVLKIVPSHLSALLEDERGRAFLPQRALVLGGEALPGRLLERIKELGGRGSVYNHYGPTETTIGVLVNALGRQQGNEESREERTIPLGRPLANTQVYILDGRMQLVPPEVKGELYIGGAGVAWGYAGQGGLTAERFVPNPYSDEQGARLYRTGDMVRYGEGGQIEFMGRADGQVKLRGYRVEVGEVEAVLRQHPQVRECIVVLRNDGEPRLVSYLVSRQRVEIACEQLEAYMRERLPEYMVPTEYVHLEEWPLTANGKVDRQRLPKPEQGMGQVKKGRMEARSPLEELTMQIWRDLVGAEIGIHDNFFAVGGNSLLATRVMARIRAVLQVELPVRAVFEAPTVASLAQRIERALREDEDIHEPPLLAGVRPEEIPLSFAQQRLWFLDQLEPDSIAYLASRALKVGGVLNVWSLQCSLQELIHRHESLRTTFAVRAGQPIQIIQPTISIALPVIDLQELRQEHKENEVQLLVSQEALRPCNLAQGPLLRAHLLRVAPQEHVMVLTLHHIITDGWSNEVLVHDLAALYQAFANKQPSPLAPLPLQYADYALWQREWLQGELLEAQLAYWTKQLADIPSLELPFDYPRLSDHTYQGATLSLELPEELSQRLIALSQQEDVTLFMLLMVAFQTLLMRYTGQTDISVGTPIANRTRTEIEGVIGFFVNTLVLRADLSGHPTFQHLLKQVREVCLQAYAHQDVPFEKLVEVLQPERDVSRSSLFQVSFQLIDTAVSPPSIPGLSLEPFGSDGASADYDLRVMMTRGPQGFSCMAFYDINLFKVQTIRHFLAHFQSLLEQVVLSPEMPVAALPLLSEQERHLQLVEWNMTQHDYPREHGIHQLFEQQVQRTPDALALVFEEKALTYADLNRRANQLAHHLQNLGVGPEMLVGICMERSIEMVVGLLAVLKAGGAYVPLDPSLPRERLEYMLNDAQVTLVLSQTHLQQHLVLTGITVINVAAATLGQDNVSNPTGAFQSDQLVYMIYTSGSTGKPKGAMNIHRGLVNRLTWMQQQYPLNENDRVVQKTPFSFDVSGWEFFWPLMTGARLVVAQPGGHQDPTYLKELIEQEQITTLHFVPSMLQAFLLDPANLQACTNLRRVICSGEALSAQLQARFFALAAPSLTLHNLYGPTEASIDVTFWDCVPDESKHSVPIGYPIANTQIYLLDHELQPTPTGVVGEMYIGGDGLARGYFKRPELTAERFLPNPFGQCGGERLYRTGDNARYLPTGAIEFLGRVDEQVKLRGFRIEPGEIETVLREHPAVQEAIVILREDRPTDTRLVAYTVLDLLYAEAIDQDVQAPLIAERLKHWQELYDETYRQGTSQAVQTFNIVGWNSSYTGEPIPAEEMQSWLEDTLKRVQAYHPKRIWEIGCGTGLLLFPLASTTTHYYGTDFSAAVLEGVRQQLVYLKEERGIQPAVTLLQRQADDFNAFPEEQIDTVLINSVIQYFPNVDYLLRVLEGAVRLTASGGRIIIGDVRSFPLLEAFHANVQLSRTPETLTRQQFQKQVQQHLQQEKELVLDPAFFRRWAQTTGRVKRVEVRLKQGRYHNELTQFRYQVVLHVGEPVAARDADRQHVEELNWSEQGLTREHVRQKLLKDQPSRLRLRQVPNARVYQAIQTLKWLKNETGAETVGQWRTELQAHTDTGIEPEDLREDAEQLGYHITISWEQHRGDGSYNVLLQRGDDEWWDDAEEELHPQAKQSTVDWQRFVNQPLQGEAERLLIPQIRQHLQERLPDYMVPAHLMVLKALPLSPNGKLDRRALPAPEAVHDNENNAQDAPGKPIEELIGELWSEILGRSHIGIHENFFELGGHSLLVTQLVARMRSVLGTEMPVRMAFEAPTIAEMARWVEQSWLKSEQIEMPPLLALARPEEIPLSFAQQRLWFLDQLNPNNTTYLDSGMLRFRGTLAISALESSIREIVQRHENLRTTFMVRAEQPMQVIHPVGHVVLPIIDLQNLRPEQRVEEADVLFYQESLQPCNLATGPLFRTYLLRLEPQEHLMVLTLHHIITDGWSNNVLVRELSVLYRAYIAQQPSPLAPLPLQYADYALWQRQWLQGEMLQKHIAYWQQQLKGVSSLELPVDAPRTAIQSDEGARYSFELPTDLSASLVSFSHREGVTLFMTLLAAFQVLLYRLSDQTDIVVGTDVANRTHVETEELIGFFINLLALRTNLQGAPSFRKVMQQVRATVLEAYTHQELPFALVVEHVQHERKEHTASIVQVLLVLQNTPKSAPALPGVELEAVYKEEASARFDLALFLQEEEHGMSGSVVYRPGLFKEQTIASWMRQFTMLLSSIVAKPDTTIDMLELYTDEEKIEQAQAKRAKSHAEAKRIRGTKSRGISIP